MSKPKGKTWRPWVRGIAPEFAFCLTKKVYKSEKGARMAIELNPEEAGIRYYHCRNCGYWHTTSQPYQARS